MGPIKRAYLRGELFTRQGGRCCYCEKPIYIKDHASERLFPLRTKKGAAHPDHLATLEHLRRIADGGRHSLDNFALACRPCNCARGSIDWLSYKTMKLQEAF